MALDNQLVDQQMLAQGIMEDAGRAKLFKPNAGTLAAIAKNTTAKVNERYSNPAKKQDVQLFYSMPLCGASTPTVDSEYNLECDLDGAEADSNSKTYTLDRTVAAPQFKIAERKFETSMHEANVLAAEMDLRQQKNVVEQLNARAIAVLDTTANKTNIELANWPGLSTLVDTPTKNIHIPSAKWTVGGIAQIIEEIAARTNMENPYLIDSGALWKLLFGARHNANTDQGKNDLSAASGIFQNVHIDWTIYAALSNVQRFYMVDRGILAAINRTDWANTVPQARPNDMQTYMKEIRVLDGAEFGPIMINTEGLPVNLKVDVRVQDKCDARKEYSRHQAMELSADIVTAPVNTCTQEYLGGADYTGIFAFQCGDSPTLLT